MYKVFVAFLNEEPIGASVVLLYKERVYSFIFGPGIRPFRRAWTWDFLRLAL